MQVGVIGLADGGAHLVRRLLAGGVQCAVFDPSPRLVAELGAECAYGAASVRDVAHELDAPRTILLAGPSTSVDGTIGELLPELERGDTLVAAAGSCHVDDVRRAASLAERGIRYLDVGVIGRPDVVDACCLLIGGDESAARDLDPVLSRFAAGRVFCGPAGAGRFVSMVIESCRRAHDGRFLEHVIASDAAHVRT